MEVPIVLNRGRSEATGMHMVVRFQRGTTPARMPRQGVRLADTRAYYLGAAPPNEFIFCFSGIGERTIREGIRRLAA